jgi:hypothetical protein
MKWLKAEKYAYIFISKEKSSARCRLSLGSLVPKMGISRQNLQLLYQNAGGGTQGKIPGFSHLAQSMIGKEMVLI